MHLVRGLLKEYQSTTHSLYDDVTYVYDDVTYVFYHKTVVVVNAPSARVTEGVLINNTLSL